jgi:hypothetical protein
VVDYAFVVTETEEPMGEQLTLDEALEGRDAVLAAVAENNSGWIAAAMETMARVPDGTRDTGEGFRRRLLEKGLRPPAHHNAWGSLMMNLTKRKVLVPTGEYRAMLSPQAHGRRTPCYVKQTPQELAA